MEYIKDIIKDMESRMENLKVFYPFFHIYKNPKSKDKILYDIPFLSLSLLHFILYEEKIRLKEITLKEISEFIILFIKESYGDIISFTEAKDYSVIILDNLQNYGNNFLFQYYNSKAGASKEKFIKLIETKIGEHNKFYYSITKEGMDFFLKTKEFPEEAEITINLLLFRKQIETGAFELALETLSRLNIEVQKKLEKRNWLLDQLMYGGEDGVKAYNDYHNGVKLQFEEEEELFREVIKLIRETYDKYIEKINRKTPLSKEEDEAFRNLNKIHKEMDRIIEAHNSLLKLAAGLSGDYEKILNLKREACFSEKFDFAGELDHIVTDIANPEALKFISGPFLKPYKKKIFNPMRIFRPQKMIYDNNMEDYEATDRQEETDRETLDDVVKRRVIFNFKFYAFNMLKMLEKYKKFNLLEWTDYLKELYGDSVIYYGDFVAYLVKLNHYEKKEFRIGNLYNVKDLNYMELLFKDILEKRELNISFEKIKIKSVPDEDIELNYGLKITNIIFRGV